MESDKDPMEMVKNAREHPDRQGCQNNPCHTYPGSGMLTQGRCRCSASDIQTASHYWHRKAQELADELERVAGEVPCPVQDCLHGFLPGEDDHYSDKCPDCDGTDQKYRKGK